jgi:lipopolysaccharide transport system permease protein
MAGITAWNYFSDCITKTSTVFKDNANIFGKVYFPRLILPLSIVASNLVRFAVQMLLMVLMMGYYSVNGANFHITWAITLFPILVILMALLGLGLGLIITALTTKYRDLSFLITFGVQLLMYTTTVIYPLSSAPEKYKSLISLNPMTGIIECFRFALFGQGNLTFNSIGYSTLFTFISLVLGVLVFNKTEKTFVDTV